MIAAVRQARADISEHLASAGRECIRALLDAYPSERDRGMALLALAAELPEVDVILDVARRAVTRQLDLSCGLAVALCALQLLVCAAQRKTGVALVVEGPDVPAVRRMTVVAPLTEASPVLVCGLVAAVAICCGACIRRCEVALLAWHGDVLADQRESTQVVIEAHLRAPTIVTVAAVASSSELACVHIVRSVTVGAFRAELLGSNVCGVACVTVNFAMLALQLEADGVVIEARVWPALRRVAALACGAEASRVEVLRPVATLAILRYRVLHPSGRMAAGAIRTRVRV